jgi:hypothetical protein
MSLRKQTRSRTLLCVVSLETEQDSIQHQGGNLY